MSAPAAPERPGGDSRCFRAASASRAAASRPSRSAPSLVPLPAPSSAVPAPADSVDARTSRPHRGSRRRRDRGEAPVLLRLRSAPSRAVLSLRRPRRTHLVLAIQCCPKRVQWEASCILPSTSQAL